MQQSNKIISLLLLIVLAISLACMTIAVAPAFVVGAVVVADNDFDDTAIEDDLADIDLTEYPKDPNGEPRLVQLVEYCYSDNAFKRSNYGLYIYVYNPAQTALSTREGANVMNMATEYDGTGKPSAYENVGLTYLSRSTEEGYEGLFYKFKVTDSAALLDTVTAYSDAHGIRRYDVAGLQLRDTETGSGLDCNVSYTFEYTGYAKGYGPDTSVSTLDCDIRQLETVELEVHTTFFRPEGTNKPPTGTADTVNTQDQLSSVYFAVPNGLIDDYGALQRIKAEWWEYRTRPVWVIGNSDVYDKLNEYVGKDISSGYEHYPSSQTYYAPEVKYGLAADFYSSGMGVAASVMDYGFNLPWYTDKTLETSIRYGLEHRIDYLFKATTSSAGDYTLRSDELLEYMRDRSAGADDLICGKYSRELLTEDVGEGRTAGYNLMEIDADEEYDLMDVSVGDSFWDRLFGVYTSERYEGIKAIYAVSDGDFKSDPAETCRDLFIDEGDYADFKSFYDAAKASGRTVFLFRFAQTDYYGAQVTTFERGWLGDTTVIDTNAYMAMQNVFLDFDVISLTFNKAGVYTVIAAVSDPIDVIGDIVPPSDWEDPAEIPWWLIVIFAVLGVIVLLLLLPILWPIIKLVLKAVVWIVCLPFRLIAWVVKKIRGDDEEK